MGDHSDSERPHFDQIAREYRHFGFHDRPASVNFVRELPGRPCTVGPDISAACQFRNGVLP
jgi:hypothetical protein